MIPKIIHYCWFGQGKKPRYVEKCISSWRTFMPDYEIREWNESNFDVNLTPFTQEAYKAKKFAFVSDIARFWILYKFGGLYFDTDVELTRDLNDIVSKGSFMGVETPSINGMVPTINPGLAFGSEPGNPINKAILDHYQDLHFVDEEGKMCQGTVVTHTTEVLANSFGLQPSNEIQQLEGITIYPVDYFNPFNDLTGVLTKTSNTHSIHWFAKSWIDKPMIYFKFTRMLHRYFGVNVLDWLK